MNGVLNVYKPQNMTSHDVVAIVRRALNIKKVGHTGTLDPMATGVLPVCIGRATKIVDFIQADKKTYRTQMTLGLTTDTEDCWGTVLKEVTVNLEEAKINEAILSFVGEIDQIPPMYSALKVNGKKLYELAREGKTIERASRRRTIYAIDILSIKDNIVEFTVECSKGTYIRTLCADIGKKLGVGGIMSGLERTHTGQFNLTTALTIETIKSKKTALVDDLMPIEKALSFQKKINISPKALELVQNGVKIDLKHYYKESLVVDEYVLVYQNTLFIALAKYDGVKLIVDKLFELKRV